MAITLFLIFLVLKLTELVTWSWWVVCSPLIVLVFLILFAKATEKV